VDRVDLIEEEQRKNEWQNSDSMNMDLKNHSIESYKVRF
jgi:hypothetical protein